MSSHAHQVWEAFMWEKGLSKEKKNNHLFNTQVLNSLLKPMAAAKEKTNTDYFC